MGRALQGIWARIDEQVCRAGQWLDRARAWTGQVRAEQGRHMLGKMDRADGKWEG